MTILPNSGLPTVTPNGQGLPDSPSTPIKVLTDTIFALQRSHILTFTLTGLLRTQPITPILTVRLPKAKKRGLHV